MNDGGAAAAAAYQTQIDATLAQGAIVRVEPHAFVEVVRRSAADSGKPPLVVVATGGWFGVNYKYLTGYKGLFFHTKTSEPLRFALPVEWVKADKIWIPS